MQCFSDINIVELSGVVRQEDGYGGPVYRDFHLDILNKCLKFCVRYCLAILPENNVTISIFSTRLYVKSRKIRQKRASPISTDQV